MSCKWLAAVILLFTGLNVSSQNLLKSDYAEAVSLNINQKYVFKNAAVGFGRQEYPQHKTRKSYLFEKERNTAWFKLYVSIVNSIKARFNRLQVQLNMQQKLNVFYPLK